MSSRLFNMTQLLFLEIAREKDDIIFERMKHIVINKFRFPEDFQSLFFSFMILKRFWSL